MGGLHPTGTSSPFCSTCRGRSTVKFKSETSVRLRMTVVGLPVQAQHGGEDVIKFAATHK